MKSRYAYDTTVLTDLVWSKVLESILTLNAFQSNMNKLVYSEIVVFTEIFTLYVVLYMRLFDALAVFFCRRASLFMMLIHRIPMGIYHDALIAQFSVKK